MPILDDDVWRVALHWGCYYIDKNWNWLKVRKMLCHTHFTICNGSKQHIGSCETCWNRSGLPTTTTTTGLLDLCRVSTVLTFSLFPSHNSQHPLLQDMKDWFSSVSASVPQCSASVPSGSATSKIIGTLFFENPTQKVPNVTLIIIIFALGRCYTDKREIDPNKNIFYYFIILLFYYFIILLFYYFYQQRHRAEQSRADQLL